MRQLHTYRTLRTAVATLVLIAITGCGEPSLESVGERSGEWIGSLTNGATFLPSERNPETVMATP